MRDRNLVIIQGILASDIRDGVNTKTNEYQADFVLTVTEIVPTKLDPNATRSFDVFCRVLGNAEVGFIRERKPGDKLTLEGTMRMNPETKVRFIEAYRVG